MRCVRVGEGSFASIRAFSNLLGAGLLGAMPMVVVMHMTSDASHTLLDASDPLLVEFHDDAG